MYPGSKYSNKPPSPTFVNFSLPSDYPSGLHHHHNLSMSMRHMITQKGASLSSSSKSSATTLNGGNTEIIFPEDDTIEFRTRTNNNEISCPADFLCEKRRKRLIRRSNHKLEVEQQVN